MLLTPKKHGAENIFSIFKKRLIYIQNMLIKHGIQIVLEQKRAKEPPCFQESQNRPRMEEATNI